MLKKLVKTLMGILLLAIIGFGVLYAVYNRALPNGKAGPEAEAMAQKMLKALNYDDYIATRYLEWTFAGRDHRYVWDTSNGKVTVRWDDYRVDVDLINKDYSRVFQKGELQYGTSRVPIIEKAISFFNNDSFWLVAPFKVFDQATKRSIVPLADGSNGLLVTYTRGGTTPGDSYLWKLDARGFPLSFQMWTKIIPVGGLTASWDDWQMMETGFYVPTSHKIGPFTLKLTNIRGYD
ncbi:MAG: hypothetical protein MUO53_04810 [Maribacter sp.]|nr:hypothetical protein [Maribacter sp.]